jgi:hypothetical protein
MLLDPTAAIDNAVRAVCPPPPMKQQLLAGTAPLHWNYTEIKITEATDAHQRPL